MIQQPLTQVRRFIVGEQKRQPSEPRVTQGKHDSILICRMNGVRAPDRIVNCLKAGSWIKFTGYLIVQRRSVLAKIVDVLLKRSGIEMDMPKRRSVHPEFHRNLFTRIIWLSAQFHAIHTMLPSRLQHHAMGYVAAQTHHVRGAHLNEACPAVRQAPHGGVSIRARLGAWQ